MRCIVRLNDLLTLVIILILPPPLRAMGDVALDKLSDCQRANSSPHPRFVAHIVVMPLSAKCYRSKIHDSIRIYAKGKGVPANFAAD